MKNYKKLLRNITTFIFDYDGVFTNGTVILMDKGEPLRTANVKDGYAVQMATKKGYNLIVISGGRSESIMNRFKLLNVQDVFLGVDNKLKVYQQYLKQHKLNPENILYMGDDIPDMQVMKEVGLAVCPADAVEEIKAVSHYISHCKGGEGCVRDVIEQVLKIQGKWMNGDAFHW